MRGRRSGPVDLRVAGRTSSFAFKGKDVDIREIGAKLRVGSVLEGSVRRAGDEVRINAQLIDATTGGHLWADRYDGTLEDIFGLQDRVTQRIVAALAVEPFAARRSRTSMCSAT